MSVAMICRSAASRFLLPLGVIAAVSFGLQAPAGAAPAAAKSKVPVKPATAPKRVSGSHILISYTGAQRAAPGVTRSKEEARKRAAEAVTAARKPGDVWNAAVAKYTDDPRGKENDGMLGIFQAGQLRGPFQPIGDALLGMEIGQVSDVVESPMGFHVLTRTPIVEYAAAHILIQYKGAMRAKPDVTRSKDKARELAMKVLKEAQAPGADFAALAKKYSDGPSARRGGDLGVFGRGQMVPAFDKALQSMKVGEVKGPVETPFGYHIMFRKKIERIGASHILIVYKGAMRAKPDITRSKEEARELATKITKEAQAPGADFAALAKKYSDGPSGPRGGALGLFGKGRMVPEFEKAAFALKVGEVKGPVESPFGFHVIKRTE